MKVRVFYTKPCVMEREVDDKFFALTEEGGWGSLPIEDRDVLTDELCEVVDAMLDDEGILLCVETTEDEVLLEL